ncbi:hypothetical protein [Pseudaminobacter sp. NGMCC 1.201702]|uniref:hypothetical protein n=1 Tax=Pseudaminobacter sp. NGMCC 1.201702 TaxID=3391825 RepID=UPI0039F135FB
MSELDWQHEAVWRAIDQIATDCALSTSRLAIMSGHDSTAFNKSKRVRPDGKKRWPSVGAIANVLRTAGMTYAEFGALVDQKMARREQ